MKKKNKIIIAIAAIFLITFGVIASDLVIDSDTQSYDEEDQKIKFEGNVEVTLDDVKKALNIKVKVVDGTGEDLIDKIIK